MSAQKDIEHNQHDNAAASYFNFRNGKYFPTLYCLGPWGNEIVAGGALMVLIAHLVERYMPALMFPARLTVDMYRPANMSPITPEVEIYREGKRVHVIGISLLNEGKSVARATALLINIEQSQASNTVWESNLLMNPPDTFSPYRKVREPINYGNSQEYRGQLFKLQNTKHEGIWIRQRIPTLRDVPASSYTQVANIADWGSPCSNWSEAGLAYINTDVSLFLKRLPVTDWIGVKPELRHSNREVAISDATLFDELGIIGRAISTALIQTVILTGNRNQ